MTEIDGKIADILLELGKALNLDQKTLELAEVRIKLFSSKEQFKNYSSQLRSIVGASILIDSKSQTMTSMDGGIIRGIGLGVNQIIKIVLGDAISHKAVKEFLVISKVMMFYTPTDRETQDELRQIYTNYTYNVIFYNSLQKVMKSVSLKPESLNDKINEDYLENIKLISWILFILSKKRENGDLPTRANLLMTATAYVLRQSNPEFALEFVIGDDRRKAIIPGPSKISMEKPILEYLCGLMAFEYDNITEGIKLRFDNEVKSLFHNKLGIDENTALKCIADRDRIHVLIRKLEEFYRNSMDGDFIDQITVARESRLLTPIDFFTPFKNQGTVNFYHRGESHSPFHLPGGIVSSHQSRPLITASLSDLIEFPKSGEVQMRPVIFEVDKQPRDPLQAIGGLYQWLKERVNEVEYNESIPILTTRLGEIYQRTSGQKAYQLMIKIQDQIRDSLLPKQEKSSESYEKQKSVVELKIKFFLCVLDCLLGEDYHQNGDIFLNKLLTNYSFLVAIDSFIRDEPRWSLENVIATFGTNGYDVWRVICTFKKSIEKKPRVLEQHLHELEIRIFLEVGWKEKSPIVELIKKEAINGNLLTRMNIESISPSKIDRDGKGEQIDQYSESQTLGGYVIFFKSMLSKVGLRIYNLCSLLRFENNLMEFVWDIFKFILCERVDMLVDRHIDLIVLCSVYLVAKKAQKDPKFKDILLKYQELPYINRNITITSYNGERIELGDFYNNYFRKKMGIEKYVLEQWPNFTTYSSERKATPLQSQQRNILKKMHLESPLHKTIPESIVKNPDLVMRKIVMKNYSNRLSAINSEEQTIIKTSLHSDESPCNFIPGIPKLRKRALPKFEKLDLLESQQEIKKKLKIPSNYFSSESLKSLQNNLKRKEKNIDIDEMPEKIDSSQAENSPSGSGTPVFNK